MADTYEKDLSQKTSLTTSDFLRVVGSDNVSYKQGLSSVLEFIQSNVVVDGAAAHNSIYRGKSLGTSVTAAQWSAISDGKFTDMFIGDYWTISSKVYRIAAFDYWMNYGDTAPSKHHVVLVPDANMYSHVMNDENTTTGAYVGSKMYTEGLATAISTVETAFGSGHILTHREYLKNAVTNGYESAGAWYDSKLELMTEEMVYGTKEFKNILNGTNFPAGYTTDHGQLPLFAYDHSRICNRSYWWLRDVASSNTFALVAYSGYCNDGHASDSHGVRPAFAICQS